MLMAQGPYAPPNKFVCLCVTVTFTYLNYGLPVTNLKQVHHTEFDMVK